MSALNYDELMAFGVFAEVMNFTYAAERLHLSQPALHSRVKRLTESVGEPLYVRQGRELALTRAGQELAAHAKQVASLTEDVLARIERGERAPVTLTSGPGALIHLLKPALRLAQRSVYPLRLLPLRGPEALKAVREARADVAVGVFGDEALGAELEASFWRRVGQMLVVPQAHRWADRATLHAGELHGARLIVAPARMPHRVSTEAALRAHGARFEVAVEATGWELMVHLVTCGFGEAIVNDFLTLPEGVCAVKLEGFEALDYRVVRRRDVPYEGALWLYELILSTA